MGSAAAALQDAQRLMQIEQKSTSIEKRQVVEAQKIAKIEETAVSARKILDSSPHMLFFRGGYARSNDLRNGVSIQSGITSAKARAIIEYRSKAGKFRTAEDLTKVDGLNPRYLDMKQLYKDVSVAGPTVLKVGAKPAGK